MNYEKKEEYWNNFVKIQKSNLRASLELATSYK
jgi:hypothetical protein